MSIKLCFWREIRGHLRGSQRERAGIGVLCCVSRGCFLHSSALHVGGSSRFGVTAVGINAECKTFFFFLFCFSCGPRCPERQRAPTQAQAQHKRISSQCAASLLTGRWGGGGGEQENKLTYRSTSDWVLGPCLKQIEPDRA